MLSADDPLPHPPRRILVAGTSGTGKTTLATHLAALLHFPRVEIDALFHGPRWTPRESFVDDVERFTAGTQWITELQYRAVRPLLLERADTLIWLDYPRRIQMSRLTLRTLRRRLLRQELWNGNIEPPLHTIFTDPDHIIRWGWRTRHRLSEEVPTAEANHPHLTVVRLSHPRDTRRWLHAVAGDL